MCTYCFLFLESLFQNPTESNIKVPSPTPLFFGQRYAVDHFFMNLKATQVPENNGSSVASGAMQC